MQCGRQGQRRRRRRRRSRPWPKPAEADGRRDRDRRSRRARRPEAGRDSRPNPNSTRSGSPAGRRPDNARHDGKRHARAAPRAAGAARPAEGASPSSIAAAASAAAPTARTASGPPPARAARGTRDAAPMARTASRSRARRQVAGGKRFDKPREDWKEHRPREEREPRARSGFALGRACGAAQPQAGMTPMLRPARPIGEDNGSTGGCSSRAPSSRAPWRRS